MHHLHSTFCNVQQPAQTLHFLPFPQIVDLLDLNVRTQAGQDV